MFPTTFSLPVRAKPSHQVEHYVRENQPGNDETQTPDIPDPSAAIMALRGQGRENEAAVLERKSYYTVCQTLQRTILTFEL